ncbi:MAG: hypothetical protein K2K57_11190 [Oscillospiraceae bacterium]|nr:hypothetical protein [Oscillospiraceae bacterium]
MDFKIEIVEGHDPSSYFWFRPVILKESGKILWDEVIEAEEEFSIEVEDVRCFLAYFFYKYFDKELTYNKRRYDDIEGYISGFEWYLTYNFYTYDTLRDMIKEILETASLLENEPDDPRLEDIKKEFSIFYMCSPDDPDYINGDNSAVRKHIHVVTDFYRRFAERLTAMMENNRDTNIISVMGP